MTLENVLYTAKAHTTDGREGGDSRADDGRLDVKHSSPGDPGAGTDPEQPFAAGWSACSPATLAGHPRGTTPSACSRATRS